MCKCGCDKCETVSTALVLNESKAPMTILSEGLKHHMDANKPLTNNFYSAGSKDYFDLIAEARSLYSRGILDFTNKRDIELLTETDQGHFGMYEGKKVPLDFPIEINEYSDEDYESIDEEMVDYDFSKEELIRVIKQLKRGASTEVGMIKAFEKALGRELTDDEIRGFKLKRS